MIKLPDTDERSGNKIVLSTLLLPAFASPSIETLPPTLVRQCADITMSVVVSMFTLATELQLATLVAVLMPSYMLCSRR